MLRFNRDLWDEKDVDTVMRRDAATDVDSIKYLYSLDIFVFVVLLWYCMIYSDYWSVYFVFLPPVSLINPITYFNKVFPRFPHRVVARAATAKESIFTYIEIGLVEYFFI